jgi:uncharacterized Zn-binding protein involved in type VI secretion
MVTRYTIHKGDKTTAGGTVIGGSPMLGNHDQPIAHEGDDVSCPVCNSTGKILCDGPRWPMTGPAGKQVALSDDLCLCHCKPLPKLVASQQTMSITVDSASGGEAVQQATAQVYGAPPVAAAPASAAPEAARQALDAEQHGFGTTMFQRPD